MQVHCTYMTYVAPPYIPSTIAPATALLHRLSYCTCSAQSTGQLQFLGSTFHLGRRKPTHSRHCSSTIGPCVHVAV